MTPELKALIDDHIHLANCVHNERGIEDYLQWKSINLYKDLEDDRDFTVGESGRILVIDDLESYKRWKGNFRKALNYDPNLPGLITADMLTEGS